MQRCPGCGVDEQSGDGLASNSIMVLIDSNLPLLWPFLHLRMMSADWFYALQWHLHGYSSLLKPS